VGRRVRDCGGEEDDDDDDDDEGRGVRNGGGVRWRLAGWT
jgi:hypothetical protein